MSDVGALGPTTWADLGCGTGTFTLALADLLASGSVIHGIDSDASAIRKIPSAHVEYDTDAVNRWVPYPITQTRLTTLFNGAGYKSIKLLRSRPSLYRRAPLYAALVRPSEV